MEGVSSRRRSVVAWLLLFGFARVVDSMHSSGKWSSLRFADEVTQFGFAGSSGGQWMYGNVTNLNPKQFLAHQLTLVFANEDYYRKGTALYEAVKGNVKNPNCSAIMEPFSRVARMPVDKCDRDGPNATDFLRYVPCKEDATCPTQPHNVTLVTASQLTFSVDAGAWPSNWYVILIACSLGTNYSNWRPCEWERISPGSRYQIDVEYDVWLVNGNPFGPNRDYFAYQFSFETQGILQLYIAFLFALTLLAIIHACQRTRKGAQQHTLIHLYSTCLACTWVSVFFEFVHYMVYGQNGKGVPVLLTLGDFFSGAAQSFLMLLLLLIAKGWTITTTILTRKRALFLIWGVYVFLYLILLIIVTVQHDDVTGKIPYETVPGGIILALRCIFWFWFLYELRVSYLQENVQKKLVFYRLFSLLYSIWFLCLPIAIAIISGAVSRMYKFKVTVGVLLSLNVLSLVVMASLLWPSRSKYYFKLTTPVPDQKKLVEKI